MAGNFAHISVCTFVACFDVLMFDVQINLTRYVFIPKVMQMIKTLIRASKGHIKEQEIVPRIVFSFPANMVGDTKKKFQKYSFQLDSDIWWDPCPDLGDLFVCSGTHLVEHGQENFSGVCSILAKW